MAKAGRPMGKLHQDDVRFYVYELIGQDGAIQYVGKGSGARLEVQKRRHGLDGRVVRRFTSEAKAYEFEVAHIAAVNPVLNICKGGNGCRAARRKPVRDPLYALCEKIGTRAVAARMVLLYGPASSKTDEIRRVAYEGR